MKDKTTDIFLILAGFSLFFSFALGFSFDIYFGVLGRFTTFCAAGVAISTVKDKIKKRIKDKKEVKKGTYGH